MAVGGAAYLVSKAIKKSRVVAFADLGMEAIYEFEVEDMPVTVAVDSRGEAVHKTGPGLLAAGNSQDEEVEIKGMQSRVAERKPRLHPSYFAPILSAAGCRGPRPGPAAVRW